MRKHGMTDYGKIFPLWKSSCHKEWVDYTNHDFVLALADGSLPRASFIKYLIQDYLFLIHFSRAWALAVTKTDLPEEMRLCASVLNNLVNEEIQLHIKTCLKEGITESRIIQAKETPENIAYTRYVLDIGHRGDFIDLLAVLAPCVMGYGEIGKYLDENSTSDQYIEWIKVYSGYEYQQSCHETAKLIDQAIARRLGDKAIESLRWIKLCEEFKQATILESAFWDMGLT